MKPVAVIVGRFNPFTRGHWELVKRMQSQAAGLPMILFVVDGAQSSKDSSRNPLTCLERCDFVRSVVQDVKVDWAGSAYHMLELLEVQALQPAMWFAGSDRVTQYSTLLSHYGMPGQVVGLSRQHGPASNVSATLARQAAGKNDFEQFKSLMPPASDQILQTLMVKIQLRLGDINERINK